MFAVSEFGKAGLWVRTSGADLRALGPHDAAAAPALAAIARREAELRVTLWEVNRYDTELPDSKTEQEARGAFAAAHPKYVRCAIVPDVYDEELIKPVVELIAGDQASVEAKVFEDRSAAMAWLREVEPSVPVGVPAWRTSRPPPGPQ